LYIGWCTSLKKQWDSRSVPDNEVGEFDKWIESMEKAEDPILELIENHDTEINNFNTVDNNQEVLENWLRYLSQRMINRNDLEKVRSKVD